MEFITDAMEMVDHFPQAAFCVKEGIIVKVNPAANARMIEPGTGIFTLLNTGKEEYTDFTGGSLYLTLSILHRTCGACVIKKKDFDLFLLDQEDGAGELQALALAARELREPLSSIMITTNRLFSASGPEDSVSREHAARINRSLFQMLRLIGNMSDANRYAAETSANMELRDVCGIFWEILEKAGILAEHAGIHLESTVYPEPVFTLVDPEKLERAIYNILSNALKFTPSGGIVRASLVRRGSKLCFCVQDSGSGIAENLRGGIFSRYTREPGLEDSRLGIGLGLLLIRSAATVHGGTVLVDQPQETGTRVTMTIAIRSGGDAILRSPRMRVDYAGEWDHSLLELSDILPTSLYDPKKDI